MNLLGGYRQAIEGITTLVTKRELDVDLLMVVAPIGAARIDYWFDGALLIFIFASSGTLEGYAGARTERDIEALMALHPEDALVVRNGREERVPANVSAGSDAKHTANPAMTACHVHPRHSPFGLDSCDVAHESMTLEVTGIAWADPALAWRQGGHARLEIRYQNTSEADPIEYPGAVVTSSDERVQTDSEAHGDPIVHPDLYVLSPCMAYDSRDHGFTLLSAVPSGTKLTFTVSAAVADGNGVSSCNATLPTAVASFVAP